MPLMLLMSVACSKGVITIAPDPLEWGEIDFHEAEPNECDPDLGGCAPMEVTLRNDGDAPVSIVGRDFDDEHICVSGFTKGSLDLGELGPGSPYILLLSVCGYGPGERDSEVSGQIVFDLDGAEEKTATLDWSFVPVRNIAVDDTAN